MMIGFIGLGRMGLPMSMRLVDAGYDLIVYDVNSESVEKIVARGATSAGSPRDVADQAETILASLPTPRIVQSVAEAIADGKQVKRFVDLSTSGPTAARQIAGILASNGIATIDSPVSGGIAGATNGKLSLMVSSPSQDFTFVEPILRNLGRIFLVGEEPGLGQTMKLVNNFILGTSLAATGEAMVFGAKAGLDSAVMIDVINASSGQSNASTDKFPRSILPGTFDFGFGMDLMCKDLRLYGEEAEKAGVPMWIGAVVRQVWQFAINAEGQDADFTAVVRPMERWSGVKLRGATKA